jgi:hypothetical protein
MSPKHPKKSTHNKVNPKSRQPSTMPVKDLVEDRRKNSHIDRMAVSIMFHLAIHLAPIEIVPRANSMRSLYKISSDRKPDETPMKIRKSLTTAGFFEGLIASTIASLFKNF